MVDTNFHRQGVGMRRGSLGGLSANMIVVFQLPMGRDAEMDIQKWHIRALWRQE